MKTKLFLILTCICYVSIYGQVDFDNHTITDNVDGAFSVYTADFNGDTYMDVVCASLNDNTIAWWTNDGLGNYGTKQIIDDNLSSALAVVAADFNGDTYMDVLACGYVGGITWYENTDGQGSFNKNIILEDVAGVSSVLATDFDGDNDMDVLAALRGLGMIVWYENTNGQGTDWEEHVITTDAELVRTINALDLDSDGDIDIISGATAVNNGKLVWYENDGQGNFVTQPTIMTDPDGIWRNTVADIDGDGDMDVIANGGSVGTVWCENDDLGHFVVHTIYSNSISEWLYPYDIDEDGDMDIISAEFYANKIAYFDNTDGQGNFVNQFLLFEPGWARPRTVHVADIDGDTDPDIISGWFDSDHINWHENLTIMDVGENTLLDFSVYPNPTTGILNIQSNKTIVQIEIHNLLGQLVLTNSNKNTIDISSVSQGVYFIKIMNENGNIGSQKVVKE